MCARRWLGVNRPSATPIDSPPVFRMWVSPDRPRIVRDSSSSSEGEFTSTMRPRTACAALVAAVASGSPAHPATSAVSSTSARTQRASGPAGQCHDKAKISTEIELTANRALE